jgi:hypothetical protein
VWVSGVGRSVNKTLGGSSKTGVIVDRNMIVLLEKLKTTHPYNPFPP